MRLHRAHMAREKRAIILAADKRIAEVRAAAHDEVVEAKRKV